MFHNNIIRIFVLKLIYKIMDDKTAEEKLNKIRNNISILGDAIYNTIDDTIIEHELEMSLTEVIEALLNATKKVNNRGIMQMFKQ